MDGRNFLRFSSQIGVKILSKRRKTVEGWCSAPRVYRAMFTEVWSQKVKFLGEERLESFRTLSQKFAIGKTVAELPPPVGGSKYLSKIGITESIDPNARTKGGGKE